MISNAFIIFLYIVLVATVCCIVGSAMLTLYDILSNHCVKTAKVVPVPDALEVSYDSERSLASAYEDMTIEDAIMMDDY